MPPKATTENPGVLDRIADLDRQVENVLSRRREIARQVDEIAGTWNETRQHRTGGRLGDARSRISDERGRALRDGDEANLRELEGEVLVLEAQLADLNTEARFCKTTLAAIEEERGAVFRDGARELASLARAAATEGDALLADLAEAATRVLAYRPTVKTAVGRAVRGLGGADAARQLTAELRPWTGSNVPAQLRLWESVELLARGGTPTPPRQGIDPAFIRSAIAASLAKAEAK